MLKRTLMIYSLTIFAAFSLQATIDCAISGLQDSIEAQMHAEILEQTSQESELVENKDSKKDLTPGLLVCNGKEDKCVKNDEQGKSPSSILFSVFSADKQDEANLLACKDCL